MADKQTTETIHADFAALAREMWDEGMSFSVIAKALGVSRSAISGICGRDKWPDRPTTITLWNAERQRILRQ